MLVNPILRNGFTLVELVIGMLVFAVAMVSLTSVIMPQVKRGVDPIWQVRAVTLAQSLTSEMRAKAFDENSHIGGACGDINPCTQSAALGPESGESRDLFDDFDDYHGLILQGSDIASSLNQSASFAGVDVYQGFSARISVMYDSDANGINDDDLDQDNTLDSGTLTGNRKLAQIVIETPAGETMVFSMFRDNY